MECRADRIKCIKTQRKSDFGSEVRYADGSGWWRWIVHRYCFFLKLTNGLSSIQASEKKHLEFETLFVLQHVRVCLVVVVVEAVMMWGGERGVGEFCTFDEAVAHCFLNENQIKHV